MNIRSIRLASAVLVLFAGCVPSLNPVYTDQTTVYDPDVLGVWGQPDNEATWELSAGDDMQYGLVYTDKDGREARFVARLAEVKGTRFLDLFPAEKAANTNAFGKLHLVPIHTIYLVRRTSPGEVELAAIDYPKLEKRIKQNPDSIAHTNFDGHTLITAPPDKLQAFLHEQRDAFTAKIVLKRRG